MKITIECSCGNKVTIPAPDKKITQFRDYLFENNLLIIKHEHNEIQIQCGKCKSWIALDLK